jgi:hypothetical protein
VHERPARQRSETSRSGSISRHGSDLPPRPLETVGHGRKEPGGLTFAAEWLQLRAE